MLYTRKYCRDTMQLSNYREYHAKSHQRKRHISASRNDNLVLKKVSGRTFKPILSVLGKQIGF